MTEREQTIVYPVYEGLYVNLTNRCSCACTFCIRQSASGVGLDGNGGANNRWLDHEPSFEEVMAAIEEQDMSRYRELVFCGYGEPTYALDVLKPVAAEVKRRYGLPVRVNTNGQGSLIHGRDIAPEFAGIVDTVSISLNASNAERYYELTRARFGVKSWEAMLIFAQHCQPYVPHVVLTVVDHVESEEEIAKCRAICEARGLTLRVRPYEAN